MCKGLLILCGGGWEGKKSGRKEGKWGTGGRGRDFPNCLVTGKVKSSYEMEDLTKSRRREEKLLNLPSNL